MFAGRPAAREKRVDMNSGDLRSPAAAAPAERGRQADSPWQMPLAAWKDVALRTWRESSKDNVGVVAAGVAFYGFLALVPLLGAVVLTYGLVAEPQTVIDHARSLTAVLPTDVAALIADQLLNVVGTSGEKKGFGLLLALAVALWGARNAAGSIVTALNIAYEEEEKRGFLKVTLLSLAMTAAAVVMALLAIGAAAVLGFLHHLLPGSGLAALAAWKLLSYALLAAEAAGAIATLYRYGPSREKARWTWITPGSAFASVAWLLLTLGFGFYVTNFGNYNATYGSLGAIVVLLTWMYLSAFVLLFGAELNSELEHQTAKDTTRGEPEPLGGRGAWAADHVAGSGETASTEQQAGPQPQPAIAAPAAPAEPAEAPGRDYIASRVASRAGQAGGLARIGMVSSVLSTAGLALLRRRGREGAGAALLAAAAGIALLRRS
jgi:membrane protein